MARTPAACTTRTACSTDLLWQKSMSAQAEIRNTNTWKPVNLALAVRISGDGGQEGRHLAKRKGLG